jgi:hypothetical protein
MEMASEEKELPKPKRRRFQLRLRTLLVLVTLASMLIGWVSWELDQRRREKVAITWVEEMGGQVSFEAEIDNGFKYWWKTATDNLFGKSVHSFRLFGDEVNDLPRLAGLKNLQSLNLRGTPASDLSPLAGLKNLWELNLSGTSVSDLSPLAGLSLGELNLSGTSVSDLSPLAGMEYLQRLYLEGTKVTEEQIEQLQLALPKCKIRQLSTSLDMTRPIHPES